MLSLSKTLTPQSTVIAQRRAGGLHPNMIEKLFAAMLNLNSNKYCFIWQRINSSVRMEKILIVPTLFSSPEPKAYR